MKGYKEVLRKEYYQTRIYETLFIKLLEYCIEHKQTLQEVINDSLFEKLKVDKEQLLEEEKELTKRVDKNFSVWTSICEKKSRLRKRYEDEVVVNVKYKRRTYNDLKRVLCKFTMEELIEMKEGEENERNRALQVYTHR